MTEKTKPASALSARPHQPRFVRTRRPFAARIPEHGQNGDTLNWRALDSNCDFGQAGDNVRGTNDDANRVITGVPIEDDIRAANMGEHGWTEAEQQESD